MDILTAVKREGEGLITTMRGKPQRGIEGDFSEKQSVGAEIRKEPKMLELVMLMDFQEMEHVKKSWLESILVWIFRHSSQFFSTTL